GVRPARPAERLAPAGRALGVAEGQTYSLRPFGQRREDGALARPRPAPELDGGGVERGQPAEDPPGVGWRGDGHGEPTLADAASGRLRLGPAGRSVRQVPAEAREAPRQLLPCPMDVGLDRAER